MTDRKLMQEALDALTYVGDAKDIYSDTIDALRARIAQPEERLFTEAQALDIAQKLFDSAALNAVPIGWVRKKEWVGLTDEEYEAMAEQYLPNCYFHTLKYAKAIEAKLKEKNT